MEDIKTLEEYMILIGNKLEKLRQNMDMTQSDITNEVGISRKKSVPLKMEIIFQQKI